MPWKDTTEMDQKLCFVRDYERYVLRREKTMKALCAEYGISRKCGYQTVRRKDEEGYAGLADRSRSPHSGSHWCDSDVVARALELRLEFPHWGAESIRLHLRNEEPDAAWPTRGTIHGWIKRAGLVVPDHRARRYPHPGRPIFPPVQAPNEQWSTDFKGHFKTRDRRYCYGLTIVDTFSRFVLGCEALTSTSHEDTRRVFERVFREYGLPDHILSDNGSPFSSNSVKRLSKLSVWWIRLGIQPRLTQPGKPQQNGTHERIHGHMKKVVCSNPSKNARAQQKQFDWFQDHYNRVRPHQSFDGAVPADRYKPSVRAYPRRLPAMEYPEGFESRRVRSDGQIKWQGQWFFLSESLVGEIVAFHPIADGYWILYFGSVELGYYSPDGRRLYLDRPRPNAEKA